MPRLHNHVGDEGVALIQASPAVPVASLAPRRAADVTLSACGDVGVAFLLVATVTNDDRIQTSLNNR